MAKGPVYLCYASNRVSQSRSRNIPRVWISEYPNTKNHYLGISLNITASVDNYELALFLLQLIKQEHDFDGKVWLQVKYLDVFKSSIHAR